MQTRKFQQRLLGWYDQNRRDLPWRAKPGQIVDPYHVWLSEIMLQQTSVAAVKDYFVKFLKKWPDVHALANADSEEIMAAWAGLGYYARARNLHKCAKQISVEHKGEFPGTASELIKLVGIGPYTSGAIAAIAFDQPEAAVDGNVERVLSRVFAITSLPPLSKAEIRSRAEALVPVKRAGDFAQGLMDLGATVCTPRVLNCPACPFNPRCKGRKLGIAANLPIKEPKKNRPVRIGTAFVVERSDGAVLLRKRPDSGLLGGMLEVPSTPWVEDKGENRVDIAAHMIEHTFTHFHLVLAVKKASSISAAEKRHASSERWVARDQLGKVALPTVMKKVLSKALNISI